MLWGDGVGAFWAVEEGCVGGERGESDVCYEGSCLRRQILEEFEDSIWIAEEAEALPLEDCRESLRGELVVDAEDRGIEYLHGSQSLMLCGFAGAAVWPDSDVAFPYWVAEKVVKDEVSQFPR